MTAQDALEFIMAGASAVEVGTATFIKPTATTDIIDGLESFIRENKIQSLSELVGVARR